MAREPVAAPRCAAAASTHPVTTTAVKEACASALVQLGGLPDWAVLFASPDHLARGENPAALACELLGTEAVVGCTGEALVGPGREYEGGPAVSLWVARWPGARITQFPLRYERTPEGGVIQGWPDELAGPWPEQSFLLLLGEPFSFPTDVLLERLNEDRPGLPIVGGMASGGHSPGENQLWLGPQLLVEGAIAVHVSGGVRLQTVVSQGCRPIGKPFVVTKAERNVVYELGGRTALLQLKELFDTLPTREQRLVQRSLHLGRVVNEYRDSFAQGDFLVRNVIGIDPNNGAVAVGDYIRTGQTVQFHVRDAEAADGELAQLLAAAKRSGAPPVGGLLFACNGRGTRMFSQPSHDALAVAAAFGELPLAGFFAAGEIGPVGGQNFVHGFTASLALFAAE